MWVLAVDAGSLLSVVEFSPKKAQAMAKKHGAIDPGVDYLLIRARVPQALEYVRDVLAELYVNEPTVQPIIIDEDTAADYHYRTIVTREEWKQFMLHQIDRIDYSSHVKEETVKRQPGPKIKDLYKALSATWRAWELIQPKPAYATRKWSKFSGAAWTKPDCKNCDHAELRHTIKGDKCNGPLGDNYRAIPCACRNYEPKPVAALPSGATASSVKSAEDSAEVFQGTYVVTEPAVKPTHNRLITEPEVWDVPQSLDDLTDDEIVELYETMEEHAELCGFRFFEPCDCGVAEQQADDEADEHAGFFSVQKDGE
jgi:hypothetical protein